MIAKKYCQSKLNLFSVLIALFLFFTTTNSNAQCAGIDNSTTICDIPNPANQTVNLFNLLGGSPISGGVWTDNLLSGGLNPLTGVLNIHNITQSGVYTYTYTAPSTPGCTDTTSIITVTVGGYAGVPGPNGVVCGDETTYNLFQLFNGASGNLGPQFNGDWFNVTSSTPITGSSINPSSFNVTVGTTFQFSYTMAAEGTCPASTVNAFLTVFPPAEPGTPQNLLLCSSDNLSLYTNLDLFTRLTGEDPGGRWTENNGTSELTSPADSFINVQNIYNLFGAGTYNFTYTVLPSNPICERKTAVVSIIIEDLIDLTGSTLVVNSDICENQIPTATYTAVLTQGALPIANGTYQITYIVTGQASSVTVTANFVGGILTFPIPNSNFQSVGTYTITITNVALSTTQGICTNIIGLIQDTLTVSPTPIAPNAVLVVDNVCEGNSTNVNLSNVSNLPDGTYSITYNLSFPNATTQTIVITITGGVSNFTLSSALITNSGTTTMTITSITNGSTSCVGTVNITDSFIVEEIIDLTGSSLLVNSDICENEIATATYSAILTQGANPIADGLYEVIYTITGQATPATVTASFVGGILSFPIPSVNFQTVGTYTITITNIKLDGTPGICPNIIGTILDTLTISPIPTAPNGVITVADVCQNNNNTALLSGLSNLPDGSYTISYLLSGANTASVTNETITISGGVANFTIPSSSLNNSGTTTITITNITNATTLCSGPVNFLDTFEVLPLPVAPSLGLTVGDSCLNQPVTVTLSGLGTLTSININYDLTGANTAIGNLQTLVVTAGVASFIIPQALIPNIGITTIFITNLSNTANPCGIVISNVTRSFTISDLPVAPTASNQSFCETDNATVANLLPTGNLINWYDSATGNTPLAAGTILATGNYYVSQTNNTTNCESTRTIINVMVDIVATPTLIANGQNFCGIDLPTLQELSNNTNTGSTIVWFDTISGGSQLPNTTLLQEGITYYGFDMSTTTSCMSRDALAVTVSLTDCNATDPVVEYDFFIPDGFSPNADGLNDTFSIPNVEFIYPNYTLEIYNRYGSLMFKGDKNKPDWDGKSKESASLFDGISPNGIYFYVVNFNKDNKSPRQGRLYLNR